MPKSPKDNEIKMKRVLNALKTIAPGRKFGGMDDESFKVYVEASMAPRQKLIELDDETIEQQNVRETADEATMKKIEIIVAGVIADEEYGSDSALYEAMGYVRKSERKSGLTRKRKNGQNPVPSEE